MLKIGAPVVRIGSPSEHAVISQIDELPDDTTTVIVQSQKGFTILTKRDFEDRYRVLPYPQWRKEVVSIWKDFAWLVPFVAFLYIPTLYIASSMLVSLDVSPRYFQMGLSVVFAISLLIVFTVSSIRIRTWVGKSTLPVIRSIVRIA